MTLSNITLFALVAPALAVVGAAPVHQLQQRDTNMQNFASAMVQVATKNQLWGVGQIGRSYAVGNDVDPTTARDRTRKLDADLLKVCSASYQNEDDGCKAISAYATAAVFAYDRGMSGADMFAALGTDRVNKMSTAINVFCTSPSYALGCSYLGNGFHSFADSSSSVQAGPYTDQFSQVAVLDLVDGATTGMTATTKRVGGLLGRDGLDIVERQGNLYRAE